MKFSRGNKGQVGLGCVYDYRRAAKLSPKRHELLEENSRKPPFLEGSFEIVWQKKTG